ncbi:hypothetical protein [Streptomyces sp. H27-H5]|uniref:hypothetical protein n=1 Tax=Streptomyces sp. H27-H5 TaxID=2996460 RepID=UPI0022712052|nr:hypothetical protein [Streptomyces sp. H27-H5]MCY0960406.1 hypothetical protein [Streptomyces sp. H27-H5]
MLPEHDVITGFPEELARLGPQPDFPALGDIQNLLSGTPTLFSHSADLICHTHTTTPETLELLRRAGHPTPRSCRTFTTADEHRALVSQAVARGERVAAQFNLPDPPTGPGRFVPDLALMGALCDKGRLAEWVPAPFIPRRTLVPAAEFHGECTSSWVAKAATTRPNGGGLDVLLHHHQGPSHPIPSLATADGELLVVEELLDIRTSWGIQFSVPPASPPILLGSTLLLTDGEGTYQGSVLGADRPPNPLVRAARETAAAAQRRGFCGYCGIDCAVTTDNRLLIYDVNFRITQATPLVTVPARAPLGLIGTWIAAEPDVLLSTAHSWLEQHRLTPVTAYMPPSGPSSLTAVLWAESADMLTGKAAELTHTLLPPGSDAWNLLPAHVRPEGDPHTREECHPANL